MKTYTITIQNKKEGLFINGNLCKPIIHNGICSIENYSAGCGHSAHANIDVTGSVSGMKKLGYWRKDAEVRKSRGFYYNMSTVVISDPLDALAYWIESGNSFPVFPLDEFEKYRFTFSI